ncbi:MAG: hypothetical protein ACK4WF_06850, partial [Candidatus Brocadiales bacterium]
MAFIIIKCSQLFFKTNVQVMPMTCPPEARLVLRAQLLSTWGGDNPDMKGTFGIETLEEAKAGVREAIDYARSLKDCKYADLRVGLVEGRTVSSENGNPKIAREDIRSSFGIRVIAGAASAPGELQTAAWGHYSQPLGRAELRGRNLWKALRQGIDRAYQRAMTNSQKKQSLMELAPALSPVRLAPVKVCKDTVYARFEEDPRQVPIKEILNEAID